MYAHRTLSSGYGDQNEPASFCLSYPILSLPLLLSLVFSLSRSYSHAYSSLSNHLTDRHNRSRLLSFYKHYA